jgi:hypothetical protein
VNRDSSAYKRYISTNTGGNDWTNKVMVVEENSHVVQTDILAKEVQI